MSSVAAQTYLTPEEYFVFERKATTKHEYLIGCDLRLQDVCRRVEVALG